MPGTFARGAFQVLQPPLQHIPLTAHAPKAPSGRGSGRSSGDLEGLTAECEHCGGPLPQGASANRMYCSTSCKQTAYTAEKRAERIAERQGRKCLWCEGLIDPEAMVGVIYCSKSCQTKSQIDMGKARRVCQHCSKKFRGLGKFCDHDCYAKSKRKIHKKECANCKIMFMPHRAIQVCCSQSCRHELQKRTYSAATSS